MMNDLKAAIFDMDGTLVDSLMIWDIIWEKLGIKFLNRKDFKPTAEDDRAVRTMTLKEATYYIHSVYKIGKSGEELFDETNEIMKKFYSNDVELKEGVKDFLEYCYTKGIKMCIASATDIKLLKIAIEHCNIGKYFDYVLSCAERGKGKNEPDIYFKALECLSTLAEETYVFEDSLIAIETAAKAGFKTVGIYDKYNYGHCEMEKISDLYISKGETLEKLIDDLVDDKFQSEH